MDYNGTNILGLLGLLGAAHGLKGELRADGSGLKGRGLLGPMLSNGGMSASTELSIGVDVGGRNMEIPALVPTLSPMEIQYLLSGGQPTDEIIKKAVQYSIHRNALGRGPFAEPGELYSQPGLLGKMIR